MIAAVVYLVINFGGYYNAAAVTVPMDTDAACWAAANEAKARKQVIDAFCIVRK
ncbi:hypothetical protein [Bordetella genomosp. 9]|uniref:hypothetical protein n=1 Tax=Bordetella genomosp. 9 TaxID=1416803 RepID=UPI0015C68713|nr:hypothetical protein [Bordetella genomosp. 9]